MSLGEPPSSLFDVNQILETSDSRNWEMNPIYKEIILCFLNVKKLLQMEQDRSKTMEKLSVVPRKFSEIMLKYKNPNQILKSNHQVNQEYYDFIDPMTISPNALTERFQDQDMLNVDGTPNGFSFFKLPLYKKLLKNVLSLIERPTGKYYFEGPQGIGKSFALLSVVMEMRKQKEFRVIYVNNPELWKDFDVRYIANELIWTFAQDEHSFPPPDGGSSKNPLEQWYQKISSQPSAELEVINFLRTAYDYCIDHNIQMVAFLDQENSVRNKWSSTHNDYCFPFNFYSGVPYVHHIFTFASASNKTRVKKTQGWKNLCLELDINFQSFCFPG